MPRSLIIIDKRDNVATALSQLEPGNLIRVEIENYVVDIILPETIPFGHKLALKNIGLGESIIKYGEVIGLATSKIVKGGHVHIHNVKGIRGRGDKQ